MVIQLSEGSTAYCNDRIILALEPSCQHQKVRLIDSRNSVIMMFVPSTAFPASVSLWSGYQENGYQRKGHCGTRTNLLHHITPRQTG